MRRPGNVVINSPFGVPLRHWQQQRNLAKRDALRRSVDAVNARGGFATWCWGVAFKAAEVHDILRRHGGAPA